MEKSPSLVISSPNIKYTEDYIYADYEYEETLVTRNGDEITVSKHFGFICFSR